MTKRTQHILTVLAVFGLLWAVVPIVQAAAPSIQIRINGNAVDVPDARPYINDDSRTMVPLRFVAENLAAGVHWDEGDQAVTITKGDHVIVLTIDRKEAVMDGKPIALDTAAVLRNNHTFVPLRFIGQTLGAEVRWDEAALTVHILTEPTALYSQKKVQVGNRSFTVHAVEVPREYRAQIGLARGVVGQVASLREMAGSAAVAVNGTYFNAYGGPPDPDGTLIRGGQVIHIDSVAATIGFKADGTAMMDRIKIKIQGATEGSYQWPHDWYAYNFNRIPTEGGSAVIVFTPARGDKLGFAYGTNVVVQNGKVVQIVQNRDAAIPKDGFVINLTGEETYLAKRFAVGTSVAYRTVIQDLDGNELKEWGDVVTGIGVGPLLLKGGQVDVRPELEGFTQDKILTAQAARSAVGIKADGTIVLAATTGITMKEWAQVMLKLGAVSAMNLDGGASSGLYFNGAYVTQPGRELSNSLLFSKP